jgi:hypothetical protein
VGARTNFMIVQDQGYRVWARSTEVTFPILSGNGRMAAFEAGAKARPFEEGAVGYIQISRSHSSKTWGQKKTLLFSRSCRLAPIISAADWLAHISAINKRVHLPSSGIGVSALTPKVHDRIRPGHWPPFPPP